MRIKPGVLAKGIITREELKKVKKKRPLKEEATLSRRLGRDPSSSVSILKHH